MLYYCAGLDGGIADEIGKGEELLVIGDELDGVEVVFLVPVDVDGLSGGEGKFY